jgi:tripartite-type tricarboxylate transporter receptor subunit TctC
MTRLLTLLALSLFSLAALAQSYPAKPVRLIVPFSPGTTSDILGRLYAEKMGQALGQPIIVENRTGAGGTIGAEAVAKSPPDGYMLLMGTAALGVSPHVYPNLKYDTAKDFAHVILISTSPLLLAANQSFPPRNLQELIAYAKANPGKVAFGAAGGLGTSHHLSGEKLKLDAGIEMTVVPYKGSGPAHVDLLGGQIPILFDNIVALLPHVKSGKVKAIGVTSAKRTGVAPEIPTFAEQGLAGYETVAWFSILVPAGTPRDIVNRLNAEAVKATRLPDVQKRLLDGGSDIVASTPEAADKFLHDEIEKWRNVVKAAGVKPG